MPLVASKKWLPKQRVAVLSESGAFGLAVSKPGQILIKVIAEPATAAQKRQNPTAVGFSLHRPGSTPPSLTNHLSYKSLKKTKYGGGGIISNDFAGVVRNSDTVFLRVSRCGPSTSMSQASFSVLQ